MKKADLTSKMEAILVANKIDLSSVVATQLLELVKVSTKVVVEKDTKNLISFNNKLDLFKGLELSKSVSSYKELESLMIENDLSFQIVDKVDSYENNEFTMAYCIWFKEYRELARFSLSKRSSNGVHYESYEAEKHWAEYGKLIKALDDDIQMIKNAVIDEVYTPAEGKSKIEDLESNKSQLVENRKNKVTLNILEVSYYDTFKYKAFAPQAEVVPTETEDAVTEVSEEPKKSKRKSK